MRKCNGALHPVEKPLRSDKKYFDRAISKVVLLIPNEKAISEDN